LKLAVSEERKARVPEREARLGKIPRRPTKPPKRARKSSLLPAGERFDLGADIPASLLRHPAFKRVVGSICPFSGLSRAELEQHVAGILAMVDEADRRADRGAAA
jgi:hypothetical protein